MPVCINMLRRDIHIGPIIRKIFLKRKMEGKITIGQFAAMLGYHRTRIYAIFESKSIDSDLLIRISNALDYNFLLEYFEDGASYIYYLVLAEGNIEEMEKIIANLSLKIVNLKPPV